MVKETMEEMRSMRKEMGQIGEEIRKRQEREGPTYVEKAALKCNPMTTRDPTDPLHSGVVDKRQGQ